MKKTIFFLLLMLLVGFASNAQEAKQRVAILDPVMSGQALDDGLRISVREIISACLVNYGENFSIVERSLLDKVMQEAKFSNTDAVDEAQATELGKLAGADKVIVSVLTRSSETRCMLSIKMINVKTATIEKQHAKLVNYDSVLDVTEPLTLAILGKEVAPSITGGNQVVTTHTRPVESKVSHTQTTADPSSCIMLKQYSYPYEPQSLDKFGTYSLSGLLNERIVNVIFDFSNANADGMPIAEFIPMREDIETDYSFIEKLNREVPDVIKSFIEEFNDNNDKNFVLTTNSQNARYTLVVRMLTIDKDGRENTCDYLFIDNQNNTVTDGLRLKAKGGHWGSFPNLMGDAFSEVGSKLGKMTSKQLKNVRKGK